MKRTPLVRRKTIRRSSMRPGSKRSRYARRPRDTAYMMFAKSLLCAVEEEWPCFPARPSLCSGVIEADHAGERGLGRKADDRTCIPMCTGHHRERHDHAGTFRHLTRDEARSWRERAIARTQTLYAERDATKKLRSASSASASATAG